MSIQEHIDHLEDLSSLDEEIRVIDEQLAAERGALSGKKEELAELEERIASDSKSIAEMSKARSDLVLEARQVTGQVEKSRDKLARSRNERESNAASRELEELRRIQRDREEELGKLMLVETQALKSKEDAEAARDALSDQLWNTEGPTCKRLEQFEARRAALLEKRGVVTAKLPRELLSRYDLIRKRRGVAIAATSDGICQACHVAAPPQLFQKILRLESLEKCPHCQRILYFKPGSPAAVSED